MTTSKIEKALSDNTKKDLTKLAKDINNLIENFAKEKKINYNYFEFKNDSYIINRLLKSESKHNSDNSPNYDALEFYHKSNNKYCNSLGECEQVFYKMLEASFYDSLHKRKVKNLINKVNLLEE